MEIVVGLDLDVDSVLDGITARFGQIHPALPSVTQYNHHRMRVENTIATWGVLIQGLMFRPESAMNARGSLTGGRLQKGPSAPRL